MNLWLLTATAMLAAMTPCGIACLRGTVEDRLAALELLTTLTILQLIILTEAFHRTIYIDLPLTLAFLSFGGGLVFARFIQRWL